MASRPIRPGKRPLFVLQQPSKMAERERKGPTRDAISYLITVQIRRGRILVEKNNSGGSEVSPSEFVSMTKANFISVGESSRRRWVDRKILRGNARVRIDLRAPPTFSGPSRKWIFERSNRKCLFIAGACTRPPDSGIPR